ncbi:MAG TPA: DUF2089 domain-containing protein [Candidatus Limnocylindria bacterium]|nr:DUF2089 domain-containing protein [Candidatus Limnocylindria bacterium]
MLTIASDVANAVIASCPICAEPLQVVRLECAACGTSLEGSFALGRFHRLAADQLDFLETFIRCRGNFKDVERELGISYPTVRSRLDAVIRALGFTTQAEPDRDAERRKEILKELADGRIAPDDAAALLENGGSGR